MTRIPKEHFTICFENIFLVQGMTNKSHEIFTKRNNWIQQRVVSRIRLYFCFILIVFYSYSATPWQHTRRELSLPRLWLVSDIDSFFFFSKVDWKLVISIHQVIAFTMTWLLPLWCCFLIFFIYFFLLFFFCCCCRCCCWTDDVTVVPKSYRWGIVRRYRRSGVLQWSGRIALHPADPGECQSLPSEWSCPQGSQGTLHSSMINTTFYWLAH